MFVWREAYQTIDLCTKWRETDVIDSDFTNWIRQKSLSDNINEIRHHLGYKTSIDIVTQNEIELLEGIEHT